MKVSESCCTKQDDDVDRGKRAEVKREDLRRPRVIAIDQETKRDKDDGKEEKEEKEGEAVEREEGSEVEPRLAGLAIEAAPVRVDPVAVVDVARGDAPVLVEDERDERVPVVGEDAVVEHDPINEHAIVERLEEPAATPIDKAQEAVSGEDVGVNLQADVPVDIGRDAFGAEEARHVVGFIMRESGAAPELDHLPVKIRGHEVSEGLDVMRREPRRREDVVFKDEDAVVTAFEGSDPHVNVGLEGPDAAAEGVAVSHEEGESDAEPGHLRCHPMLPRSLSRQRDTDRGVDDRVHC